MPEGIFQALFFGCVLSVPVAAFSVGALYRRAGFSRTWVVMLHAVGAIAIFGNFAFFGVIGGGTKVGAAPAGVTTIFITAILITAMAAALAIRPWPSDNADK